MQISQLLLNRAERFNQAADLVCSEWSIAVCSSGICSPCDRAEFNRLIKIKIAASDHESPTAVHTIKGTNHVHKNFTARVAK